MPSSLRTITPILLALLLGQFSPAPKVGTEHSKASAALTSEQIEVYRAFLSQYTCAEAPGCESEKKYLMNVTTAQLPGPPIETRCIEPWHREGKCCLQGITLEARPKSIATHLIPLSALSHIKISLVTEKRAQDMMNKRIYQLFQLSEIAFSVDHHFAVLFYSVGSSSGDTAILEQTDGKWKFDQFRSVACVTGSES